MLINLRQQSALVKVPRTKSACVMVWK